MTCHRILSAAAIALAPVVIAFSPIRLQADTAMLTLSAYPDTGGTVSPMSTTVNTNEPILISAAPADGFEFAFWTPDSEAKTYWLDYSYQPSTYLSVNASTTVTAHFVPVGARWNLTMRASPDEAADSLSPAKGSASTWDSSVAISATAAAGWLFSHWSAEPEGNVVFRLPTEPSTELVMGGDATVTANFTQTSAAYAVAMAVEPSESGTATYSTTNSDCLAKASSSDWHFSHWTAEPPGSAVFQWAEAECSFVNISGDVKLTAHFTSAAPEVYRIFVYPRSYEKTDFGTVSLSGIIDVKTGTSTSMIATPGKNCIFSEFYSVGISGGYTDRFTSLFEYTPIGNRIIEAWFGYGGEMLMTSKPGRFSFSATYLREDVRYSSLATYSIACLLPKGFDFASIDESTKLRYMVSGYGHAYNYSFNLSDATKLDLKKGTALFKDDKGGVIKLKWNAKTRRLALDVKEKSSSNNCPLWFRFFKADPGKVSGFSPRAAYVIFGDAYWQGDVTYSGVKKKKTDKKTLTDYYIWSGKGAVETH